MPTVFVTGANRGLGYEHVKQYAEKGWKVIACARNPEQAKELKELQKKHGENFIIEQLEVVDHNRIEELAEKYSNTAIDILINNAGTTGAVNKTENVELDDWLKVINTNLNGVWYCMKYQLKQMSQQNLGVIVNTSSISGLHGVRNQAAYSASKHGVIGLTKSAALEYAKTPIRINVICPGWTETKMGQHGNVHDTDPRFLSDHVVGRSGNTNEIAETVLWLSSPLSSFVNGHAMITDGGRMAL